MKRPVTIFALIIAVLLFGGALLLSKGNAETPNPTPLAISDHEYYWGDGCPHCANVAEFMETWEGKDKLSLQKYEVYNSSVNQARMTARYKQCGIPQTQMGVPLLVTPDETCLTGDTPIIDYFKSLKFEEPEPSASSQEKL